MLKACYLAVMSENQMRAIRQENLDGLAIEEIDGHGDGLTARGTMVGACQWIANVMEPVDFTAIQPADKEVWSDECRAKPRVTFCGAGDSAGDAGQAIDA